MDGLPKSVCSNEGIHRQETPKFSFVRELIKIMSGSSFLKADRSFAWWCALEFATLICMAALGLRVSVSSGQTVKVMVSFSLLFVESTLPEAEREPNTKAMTIDGLWKSMCEEYSTRSASVLANDKFLLYNSTYFYRVATWVNLFYAALIFQLWLFATWVKPDNDGLRTAWNLAFNACEYLHLFFILLDTYILSEDDITIDKRGANVYKPSGPVQCGFVKFALWFCGLLVHSMAPTWLHLYCYPVYLLVIAIVGIVLHPVRKRVKRPIRVYFCNYHAED